ncbi:MAG TPA: hypothetical protein VN085_03070 [Vicinamibacterales bacterium]|nr:hypothetical protein [Vicinamibacterales bacterium]
MAEELARHDRQDRSRPSVQREGRADNCGIGAEPPHPDAVPEHDAVGIRVAAVKGVTDEGAHAEHVEERRRDAGAGNLLGIAAPREGEREVTDRGHPGKARRLRAEVHHPRGGERRRLAVGFPVPQEHDVARIGERQRTEQHGVDDAEDGRVGADADRQRQQRHDREARRPPQPAHRIVDVLT